MMESLNYTEISSVSESKLCRLTVGYTGVTELVFGSHSYKIYHRKKKLLTV